MELTWCHNMTPTGCRKNLRVLRGKMDALRVQTRHSPMKYQGLERKPCTSTCSSFFYIILHHGKMHDFTTIYWYSFLKVQNAPTNDILAKTGKRGAQAQLNPIDPSTKKIRGAN